jgi:hypothetical protein
MHRVGDDRAVERGLTFRPLEDTVRGTLADAALTDDAGMKPERERELLDEWAASRGEAAQPEPSARRPA